MACFEQHKFVAGGGMTLGKIHRSGSVPRKTNADSACRLRKPALRAPLGGPVKAALPASTGLLLGKFGSRTGIA